jgi:hypothetical protein
MKILCFLTFLFLLNCGDPNYSCLYEVTSNGIIVFYEVRSSSSDCETGHIGRDALLIKTPILQRQYSNEAVSEIGKQASRLNAMIKR